MHENPVTPAKVALVRARTFVDVPLAVRPVRLYDMYGETCRVQLFVLMADHVLPWLGEDVWKLGVCGMPLFLDLRIPKCRGDSTFFKY